MWLLRSASHLGCPYFLPRILSNRQAVREGQECPPPPLDGAGFYLPSCCEPRPGSQGRPEKPAVQLAPHCSGPVTPSLCFEAPPERGGPRWGLTSWEEGGWLLLHPLYVSGSFIFPEESRGGCEERRRALGLGATVRKGRWVEHGVWSQKSQLCGTPANHMPSLSVSVPVCWLRAVVTPLSPESL